MPLIGKLIALVLLAAPAFAQSPGYLVAAGAGYTRNNGAPGVTESWVSASIALGGGMYSKTTVDMTDTLNTVRTGFCKVFSMEGDWTMGSCADAGLQAQTPVIGSFSGGVFIGYDLVHWQTRLAGVKVLAEFRITGATAGNNLVAPGFYLGFGKVFK